MDDDIELPPLPLAIEPMHTKAAMQSYARAAVLADRERHAKVDAKPVVHSRTYSLLRSGIAIRPYDNDGRVTTVTLCWTDDGRAWIESERNLALAKWLRTWRGQVGNEAAAALDGGVR